MSPPLGPKCSEGTGCSLTGICLRTREGSMVLVGHRTGNTETPLHLMREFLLPIKVPWRQGRRDLSNLPVLCCCPSLVVTSQLGEGYELGD